MLKWNCFDCASSSCRLHHKLLLNYCLGCFWKADLTSEYLFARALHFKRLLINNNYKYYTVTRRSEVILAICVFQLILYYCHNVCVQCVWCHNANPTIDNPTMSREGQRWCKIGVCVTQSRNLVLQHRSPLFTQNLEHNMFWSKDRSTTSETFEHFCLTIRQKAALSVYSMIATASQYSDLKQVSI